MTTARKARNLDPVSPAAPVDPVLAELTDALAQLRRGRFDVRLPRREGAAGALADQFNDMAAVAQRHNRDLLRIGRSVGREGRMGDRLDEESYDGAWADGARAVNALVDDLAAPTAEIARVIEAVAEGDLSQHMALEIEGRPLRGEYRRIGRTVNTMVDQLSSFADEVTRVAREVGTDGRLGGQADVRGVAGTWRALTDSVNTMASNLTNQVRSISDAATAIAQGDLSRTITVSARGEVAGLADTINALTATLRLFADEVTRVAREVGTEGLLGGQATVPGVAGTWKDLTDAVNVMAAEPHQPGPRHRARRHGRRDGRPVAEDHRGRAGRDPGAQVDGEHDGRPARLVRRRGHPRGPRGRHRRAARRPGRGAQRRGHVAGPHRQRQRAGVEPDDAGAQHRPGHHGRGAR